VPFSLEYFNLPLVSYERDTWPVRDEHSLRLFANRVLKRNSNRRERKKEEE
jgi:hypothetical protein